MVDRISGSGAADADADADADAEPFLENVFAKQVLKARPCRRRHACPRHALALTPRMGCP